MYRLQTYAAGNGVTNPPDGGTWRVKAMTQGMTTNSSGGSPIVCILWELVSERNPAGGRAFEYPTSRRYPPGHEGEPAFDLDPKR
jgi:hypothetical protein